MTLLIIGCILFGIFILWVLKSMLDDRGLIDFLKFMIPLFMCIGGLTLIIIGAGELGYIK